MTLVVQGQRGRRDVEAAPPDLGLRFTVFRSGLRLVQTLQRAVAALVQLPALGHRNPQLVERVERDGQRLDRALEHRGERDIERVSTVAQQASCLQRLGATPFGEVDVVPAGKSVFLVPRALAVAEQDDSVHKLSLASCFGATSTARYARTALRPANVAAAPSSSSMRRSWLYLQIRSVRLADPVLICPAAVPTARSAIVESSVSPERCEMIVA